MGSGLASGGNVRLMDVIELRSEYPGNGFCD